ncbi:MAG: hypothetical protein AAGA56_24515 [Myxococcota bacterium]
MLLALGTSTPVAQAKKKSHAARGLELFHDGKCKEAYREFTLARLTAESPGFPLYMARSKRCLGDLLTALRHYDEVLAKELAPDAPPAWTRAQQEAQQERKAVAEVIPRVHVTVTGARDPGLKLDDRPVARSTWAEPFPINPGEHTFEMIDQSRRKRLSIVVAEGEAVRPVAFRFESMPADDIARSPASGASDAEVGEPILWPGAVFTAVGGAGLIAGTVVGSLALDLNRDLGRRCPDNECPTDDLRGDADRMDRYATGSTVAFVAGGLFAAAGVVLLLVPPTAEASSELALQVSPTGLALQGTLW